MALTSIFAIMAATTASASAASLSSLVAKLGLGGGSDSNGVVALLLDGRLAGIPALHGLTPRGGVLSAPGSLVGGVIAVDAAQGVGVVTADGPLVVSPAGASTGARARLLTGGGAALLPGVIRGVDGVVRPLANGLQMSGLIHSAAAAGSYRWTLTGPISPSLRPSAGGVSVLGARGEILASLTPPRATDARGAALPAHFTVDGPTVATVVDGADSAAFPVVVTYGLIVSDVANATLATDVPAERDTSEYTASGPQSVFGLALPDLSTLLAGVPGAAIVLTPATAPSPAGVSIRAASPTAPAGQCRYTAQKRPFKAGGGLGTLNGDGTADCNDSHVVTYQPGACIQKKRSFLFITYWKTESGCDERANRRPFTGVVHMRAAHRCAKGANSYTWRTIVAALVLYANSHLVSQGVVSDSVNARC